MGHRHICRRHGNCLQLCQTHVIHPLGIVQILPTFDVELFRGELLELLVNWIAFPEASRRPRPSSNHIQLTC